MKDSKPGLYGKKKPLKPANASPPKGVPGTGRKQKIQRSASSLKKRSGHAAIVREKHLSDDLSQNPVFKLNAQLKIVDMNPAACTVYGYTIKELKGKAIGVLIDTPEERKALAAFLRGGNSSQKKARPYTMSTTAATKTGTTFPAKFNCTSGKDNSATNALYCEVIPQEKTGARKKAGSLSISQAAYLQASDTINDTNEFVESAFHGAFAHSDNGVGIVSCGGKWLMANQRLCIMIGCLEPELHETTIDDVEWMYNHEREMRPLELVREVCGAKTTHTYEVSREVAPGNKEWFSIRMFPISSGKEPGNGRVMFLVSNITDARRSREALKQSEANLLTIFNNTDMAFVLFDATMHVQACNNMAQQWAASEFGVEVKPGFSVETNNPGLGELLKAARAVLDGKLNDFETTYIDNDANNTVSYFLIRINPVYDDNSNRIGVQLAARDVTVSKQAEYDRAHIIEDLVRHNKDLEQFNYIVTHNLRSPAANIVGLTTLLRKETPGTPEFDRCVELLLQASKKLDSVTHDLNSILNKKKSISEIKENVNLADVVEDIKVGISDMIMRDNVAIECDFTAVPDIPAVKSYIHSIFHNLISNSIKYRHPELNPFITVNASRTAERTTIRFRDNGLGIDLKNHGHEVFGLYRRFHTHAEGKGMGLFMVKTQVESLGGKISVHSVKDGGTEFVIVF